MCVSRTRVCSQLSYQRHLNPTNGDIFHGPEAKSSSMLTGCLSVNRMDESINQSFYLPDPAALGREHVSDWLSLQSLQPV